MGREGDLPVIDQSYHDEDTLFKVRDGLLHAGMSIEDAQGAITEIMNRGIVFRERVPDNGEYTKSVEWAKSLLISKGYSITHPDSGKVQVVRDGKVVLEYPPESVEETLMRGKREGDAYLASREEANQAEEAVESRLERAYRNGLNAGFDLGRNTGRLDK